MSRRFRPFPVAFGLLVALVIGGSVTVRLARLGAQSYWIDELFSANESGGSLHTLLKVGSTEIHTPFYAGLLWVWTRIGGTHEDWTRLLSTAFAILAVVAAYRGLRKIRLDGYVRWALVAAIAAGGTSIVYSVETRSYALLLLGAVGLTAATLRAALLTLDREPVPGRLLLAWGGWVALAATAHLFGAVLALAAVLVLVVLTLAVPAPDGTNRGRRIVSWVALAGAGCSLQVAWVLAGLHRPGFAAGTSWIQAPDRRDVWTLVTTTFSAGDLTPQKDGFAWDSPIGVLVLLVLGLAAAGYGYLTRARAGADGPATTGTPVDERTQEGPAAAVLLVLAAIVIGLVFAVSQVSHLWTLRNMVIVTPALTWAAICLVAAAARTVTARRLVATVVVALLGVGLIPIAAGLDQPYKADFRGLLEYLIAVRAEQPDASYVFLGKDAPWGWKTASDRAADDPAWATLYRHVARYRRASSYHGPPPNAAPTVVTYFHGVANPHLDAQAAALRARLGADRCRRVPIYGLIVLRCD